MCSVEVNELISKTELIDRLKKQGYETVEEQHNADFYYILKVKVVDDAYSSSNWMCLWLAHRMVMMHIVRILRKL